MTVKELKDILNKVGAGFHVNLPASQMAGVMAIDDGDGVIILPTDDMKTAGELIEDLSSYEEARQVNTVFADGEESDELYLWVSEKFHYVHIDASSDWADGLDIPRLK